MDRDWNDWGYFPPSRPREAKGGIRAHSKRGGFGESWWARRWVSVLEGFDLGARLGRGRSYARRGQVLDIAIERFGEKGCRPAATLLGVTRLAFPELLVEIEATAVA